MDLLKIPIDLETKLVLLGGALLVLGVVGLAALFIPTIGAFVLGIVLAIIGFYTLSSTIYQKGGLHISAGHLALAGSFVFFLASYFQFDPRSLGSSFFGPSSVVSSVVGTNQPLIAGVPALPVVTLVLLIALTWGALYAISKEVKR